MEVELVIIILGLGFVLPSDWLQYFNNHVKVYSKHAHFYTKKFTLTKEELILFGSIKYPHPPQVWSLEMVRERGPNNL